MAIRTIVFLSKRGGEQQLTQRKAVQDVGWLMAPVEGAVDNARKTSVSLAAFVLLCFFLPWVELSCLGVRDSVSGYDLARAGDQLLWLVPLLMVAILLARFSCVSLHRGGGVRVLRQTIKIAVVDGRPLGTRKVLRIPKRASGGYAQI